MEGFVALFSQSNIKVKMLKYFNKYAKLSYKERFIAGGALSYELSWGFIS